MKIKVIDRSTGEEVKPCTDNNEPIIDYTDFDGIENDSFVVRGISIDCKHFIGVYSNDITGEWCRIKLPIDYDKYEIEVEND